MITDKQIGFKALYLAVIKTVFNSFPNLKKAVLFGSRAKGNYKPGSDADIALFLQGPDITPTIAGLLNDELPLPYTFDLLNFDFICNPDLQEHINRAGIIIYMREAD